MRPNGDSAALAAGARERPLQEPNFFSRQITGARRFFLRSAPARQATVIYGGREVCAADYHIRRATFPYYAVEFVAGGEGRLIMGGQQIELLPGMVFGYGPGVEHDITSSAERPLNKYFLGIGGMRSHRLPTPAVPRPGEILQTSAPTDILQAYEELIAAGSRETPFGLDICSAIVEYLLLRMAETAVPLGTLGTEAFETFQKCRAYIEAHYRKVADLAEIAAGCGVAAAYMCRLFKRYAFHSPWHYVLRLKMRDAAELLQSRHVLVREAAAQVGFADPFQFSRTFRKVIGVSPRQFMQLQPRH